MRFTFLITASLFISSPLLAENQTEISFDDVPQQVMDAATATAPGVTFYRVSIEVENDRPIYEFEAKDSQGKHIEVDVFEDGSIEEIEMETAFEDVPDAVLKTLDSVTPGFEPTYVEFSVRDNGANFVYEFEGRYDGLAMDIEIREDGKLLVMTEDAIS